MENEKSPCANTGSSKNPDQYFTNSDRPGKGFDKEEIRQAAKGRWEEILLALGMDQSFLSSKHGPCPFCGGKDRFRFDDKDGNGTYICGQCGPGNGFSLAAKLLRLDPKKDFPRILEIVAEMVGYAHSSSMEKPDNDVDLSGFLNNSSANEPNHEKSVKAAQTAEKSRLVLAETEPAKNDNPSLARKGVSATGTLREISLEKLIKIIGYHPEGKAGLFQGERILVIPIRNAEGILTSLSFIDTEGRKHFLAGGIIKNGYWSTKDLPESDLPGLWFLVGEGVATVLSGAMAVPGAVGVAALMNSNLPAVARMLCQRYPKAKITILADLEKAHG